MTLDIYKREPERVGKPLEADGGKGCCVKDEGTVSDEVCKCCNVWGEHYIKCVTGLPGRKLRALISNESVTKYRNEKSWKYVPSDGRGGQERL